MKNVPSHTHLVAAGGFNYTFVETHGSLNVDDHAPTFDLADLFPQYLGVSVQRQGRLSDQSWGVDMELRTPEGSLSSDDAREWAYAVLAAADLAEQFELGSGPLQ